MSKPEYENVPDPASPLDLAPVAGRIGAEVRGATLTAALSDGDVAALRAALARHKVLFFRGQHHLDDDSHFALGGRLGDVIGHPTATQDQSALHLVEIDSHTGRVPNSWHTDMTFLDTYPEAALLRGVVVPPVGGDTLFANTAAAYRHLPDQLRDFVDKGWAVHSNLYDYAATRNDATEEEREYYTKVFASTVYETAHPLVRVHPETGERSLVLGHFVQKIVDLSTVDSARLFAILQEHITRPENVVRWRWQPGDIVMWDNRATQHSAVADFGTQRRIVRRATLKGPAPVSIDGERSRVLRPKPAALAGAA